MNPLHKYSPGELLAALRDHPDLAGRSRNAIATSVLQLACQVFDLEVDQLTGPRGAPYVAKARLAAMASLYELGFIMAEVGSFFGNRDHSAVMHARRRLPALCREDSDFETLVHRLRSHLALPLQPPVVFSQTSGKLAPAGS